jgi:hypothetical protein
MNEFSSAKAASISAALERVAKELSRIADEFPKGYGDRRTADFGNAISCLAAGAKEWSRVMWARTADIQRAQKAAEE